MVDPLLLLIAEFNSFGLSNNCINTYIFCENYKIFVVRQSVNTEVSLDNCARVSVCTYHFSVLQCKKVCNVRNDSTVVTKLTLNCFIVTCRPAKVMKSVKIVLLLTREGISVDVTGTVSP